MTKITTVTKLILIFVLTAGLPSGLQASRIVASIRSVGMLSEESFEVHELPGNVLVKPASELEPHRVAASPFFGSTMPVVSTEGAVKTFSVKVVKNLSSKDWSRIKRENSQILKSGNKVMIRPVIGRVSSSFGNRIHPTRRSRHFHTGVDIVARRGTPIASGLAGKVSFAGWRRGYGLMVIISHGDGLETVYAHCSKVLVRVGEVVSTGQHIARVGSTGVATGAHVHFEVRQGGNVRNPFRFFKS